VVCGGRGATVLRRQNQTLSIKTRKDTLRPVAPPTPNGDPASPSDLIHLVSVGNSSTSTTPHVTLIGASIGAFLVALFSPIGSRKVTSNEMKILGDPPWPSELGLKWR
jgi:hypothetical protein